VPKGKKAAPPAPGPAGEPPPGMTKMQEMAWKKKQKAKS
jgi:hypothetical protein